MRNFFYSFFLLSCLAVSGCSVHKAASNEGVDISDIAKCKSRGALLSHGMKVIDSRTLEDGRILETYRAKARKSGANYLRAAGHGVLDVLTVGLWEVVGTPVEGAISNNLGYVVAEVTYPSKNYEFIDTFQLYDAKGSKVALVDPESGKKTIKK